ncbi:hypothetical protein A2526_06445 [candidate division WOR-1 bacterium RIFOXYD2_FULL_36_8]|uniref:Flagellar motor switch protein FliG n=1 Tax=candidate division WOR-1 bacterium RIFOXYB2_FULL_36_35 TaxID=1802578 RepID=A0A1F4S7F5_UNCSA|nr:MAG: hypothetical protein A2230_01660 [candidate division WOR-1 bacterium RIFOXYA2_FULL_36_21]OGC15685.1 MAG: hypothetical protein A2282_04385 [candidate division WOR-1 bacterium RIFOXYA12_FULL_36_13]OGC16317.1 MAG: hypothetical protein A2290_04385 [candidate division WOR-1 bacterium RIFOXYB2_FULL_36_35]OGC41737.1 MAG: hypothetical protein A2526_06445 [candidate division WOR-1 bacterium RIFOXYD2_FULL_36_8]
MKLTGKEKATIFLSILGSDTSSAILRYLPPDLADLIASSISHLPTPTPEALGEIFEDFQSYFALPSSNKKYKDVKIPELSKMAQPSNNLVSNFDEEFIYGKDLKETETVPLDNLPPKEKLLSADAKKIANILSEEKPQVAAFVLGMFPFMKKEEILMEMTVNRDQVDELIPNLKQTPFTLDLQEKLTSYFAERV